jgi:hypothetical protein
MRESGMVEGLLDSILLEPVQEELLVTIVEAARNVPCSERRKFMVVRCHSGDLLIHPGLSKDNRQAYFGDVEILAQTGLLSLSYYSSESPLFDVTPLGFRYYEYFKKQSGEPIERIQSAVRSYLNAQDFQGKYSEAFGKWSSAEDLLWRADTNQQLTTIGHLCREAVQEFANVLVEHFQPPGVTEDKSKTIARLKAVLGYRARETGSTVKPFLESLLRYWRRVNDLIQRQEHGAQKEGEKLVWEDGRRVVFHTAIVMFEIDSALSRAH